MVGFGSSPAPALSVLISSAAARAALQLSRGERLLRGMQQIVKTLPHRARLLLRGPDLREPALLDDRQRGLEAPRQVRRANRRIQRLPPRRQFRVVDGRARGKLLGLDDQRFGAGERLALLLPQRDALFRLIEPGERRIVAAPLRLFAQRGEFGAQTGERIRPRRAAPARYPFAQPALELRPRPLLVLLAIEARLDGLAGGIAAREAGSVAAHVQRLPAAIEFDHRGEYRAGLDRQRFQLRDDGVRFACLPQALLDRIDPLPGEPGHAVILVLCRVGEFAQTVRRPHALRGRHPRLRVLGAKRELDQRVFIADAGDRDAAALRILRAARHFGADRIGAVVRLEQRPCAGAVLRFGKHVAQRRGEGNPHCGIGFRFPGRGERREIGTTPRRGGADLRCGVGGQQRASSSESGASCAAPRIRCAGSACSCRAEWKRDW